MTPLKIETIQDKLFRLERNIEFIEDILKDSDEKFRIVHDYDNVDHTKVMEYARQSPQIFRVFGKAFRDFVIKKDS